MAKSYIGSFDDADAAAKEAHSLADSREPASHQCDRKHGTSALDRKTNGFPVNHQVIRECRPYLVTEDATDVEKPTSGSYQNGTWLICILFKPVQLEKGVCNFTSGITNPGEVD